MGPLFVVPASLPADRQAHGFWPTPKVTWIQYHAGTLQCNGMAYTYEHTAGMPGSGLISGHMIYYEHTTCQHTQYNLADGKFGG